MKTTKKNTILKAIVACLMVVAAFAVLKIHASQSDNVPAIVKENVEALSAIQRIGDKLYVVDTIPCYSQGNHSWKNRGFVYIDCSTCEQVKGVGTGPLGNCINVRTYEAK